MLITPLKVVKFLVSGAVGLGTGKVVHGIVENNVTPKKLFDKVTIIAATTVISAMASSATKQYSDDMIDETVTEVKNIRKAFKDARSLSRINNMESTWDKEGLDQDDFMFDSKANRWVPKPVTDENAA